jgi:hypothetical protein
VSAPPETGLIGDGLTNFQEFRGFVVDGIHVRTDPETKDLFTSWAPSWGIGYAQNLPLSKHLVRGEDEFPGLQEYGDERVINGNRANFGSGGDIPGSNQKALRVRQMAAYLYGQFGFTCTIDWDATCEAWVPPPGFTLYPVTTPNRVRDVRVWPSSHDDLTKTRSDPNNFFLPDCTDFGHLPGASCPYTAAQAANEVRRTFGHEIGHAVNICHRGDGSCSPSDVGVPPSVMSTFAGGPPSSDATAQYDDFDTRQIRFHERTGP